MSGSEGRGKCRMKTGKDGMKGVRDDEEKVEGRCGMKTGKEGMKEVRDEGK